VKKTEVEVAVSFEANAQTAEAIKPSEKPFDLPAVRGDFAVGASPIATLATRFDTTLRDTVSNASPMEVAAELATIVTAVGGQSGGAAACATMAARHLDGFQGGNGRRKIMDFSAIEVQSQGHPVTVHHHMPFAGQSSSGATDFVAPFFAFT
jgi:hypothetical protein